MSLPTMVTRVSTSGPLPNSIAVIISLKQDSAETRRVRRAAAGSKAVKITINIDADTLAQLKQEASATGVPYQRMINRRLREHAQGAEFAEVRLARLEREIARMKRKFAA